MGFHASLSDTSLFMKKDGSDIIILLLYVGDIILTWLSTLKIKQVVQELYEVFDLKDLGKLTFFFSGVSSSLQRQ